MTQEEKSKAYDEALKKAKQFHDKDLFAECNGNLVEYIFPELAESEDERIRKTLIEMFSNVGKKEWKDIPTEKIIAWLEKQGCKNPDGNVEPKFKVGDWINGYYTNYKVLSVNNKGYVVEDVYGNKINILFENEKFHHLWTIQDAKDGEVLAEGCIFIVRKLGDNLHAAKTYFTLYDDGDFDNGTILNFDADAIHPATKEQRDLLFAKIKEAGYEWDNEHKRLLSLPLKDTKRKDMSQQIKLKEPDVYEYELERIVDKLNEVIGKLGDIYQVLSKPFQFPHRDYTPPQEPWYKTHGVEKVTPVICGTLNSIETDNGKDNDKERTN